MTDASVAASPALALAFQDLEDAKEDFRQAEFKDAAGVLNRLILTLEREPLASFLLDALPEVNLDDWLSRAAATAGSHAGSTELSWPHDRAERVAMQISVCRAIASQELDLVNFMFGHFHCGYALPALVFVFQSKIISPLLRDLKRLSERRQISSVLTQSIGRLPASGDVPLDDLFRSACERFRDPAPAARNDAIEKLWDGWERLKTLAGGDKSASAQAMLDAASSPGSRFRELLEVEARALTKIGNDFHIRHFETNKTPLLPAEVDYLFHRMFAIVEMILNARARSG